MEGGQSSMPVISESGRRALGPWWTLAAGAGACRRCRRGAAPAVDQASLLSSGRIISYCRARCTDAYPLTCLPSDLTVSCTCRDSDKHLPGLLCPAGNRHSVLSPKNPNLLKAPMIKWQANGCLQASNQSILSVSSGPGKDCCPQLPGIRVSKTQDRRGVR